MRKPASTLTRRQAAATAQPSARGDSICASFAPRSSRRHEARAPSGLRIDAGEERVEGARGGRGLGLAKGEHFVAFVPRCRDIAGKLGIILKRRFEPRRLIGRKRACHIERREFREILMVRLGCSWPASIDACALAEFRQFLPRIEKARLHCRSRDADDLCDVLDRFLVVVDQFNHLAMLA